MFFFTVMYVVFLMAIFSWQYMIIIILDHSTSEEDEMCNSILCGLVNLQANSENGSSPEKKETYSSSDEQDNSMSECLKRILVQKSTLAVQKNDFETSTESHVSQTLSDNFNDVVVLDELEAPSETIKRARALRARFQKGYKHKATTNNEQKNTPDTNEDVCKQGGEKLKNWRDAGSAFRHALMRASEISGNSKVRHNDETTSSNPMNDMLNDYLSKNSVENESSEDKSSLNHSAVSEQSLPKMTITERIKQITARVQPKSIGKLSSKSLRKHLPKRTRSSLDSTLHNKNRRQKYSDNSDSDQNRDSSDSDVSNSLMERLTQRQKLQNGKQKHSSHRKVFSKNMPLNQNCNKYCDISVNMSLRDCCESEVINPESQLCCKDKSSQNVASTSDNGVASETKDSLDCCSTSKQWKMDNRPIDWDNLEDDGFSEECQVKKCMKEHEIECKKHRDLFPGSTCSYEAAYRTEPPSLWSSSSENENPESLKSFMESLKFSQDNLEADDEATYGLSVTEVSSASLLDNHSGLLMGFRFENSYFTY